MELKYFKPEEFQKCVPSCCISDCDDTALLRLDRLRELCGFPIKLNSAYRSSEYDKQKGRSGESAHCRGKAFDIRCTNSYERAIIVNCAFKVGFVRVGVATRFIHVDCDVDKPYPRIWLY